MVRQKDVPTRFTATTHHGRSFYYMSAPDRIFRIEHDKAAALCQSASERLAQQNFSAATEILLQALGCRPSSALAYKLLGEAYTGLGDEQSARLCRQRQFPAQLPNVPVIPTAPEFDRCPAFPSETWFAPAPGCVVPAPVFDAGPVSSIACFADIIRGGMVWHDDASTVVCDQSGAVLPEHTVGSAVHIQSLMSRYQPLAVDGRAIVLGARGAHNFYHWITDIIPKFFILHAAGLELNSSDTYIVSRAAAGYARQLLAQFDVQPAQVIETESASPFIIAQELVVPYLKNKMGYGMGSWLPANLKQQMNISGSGRASRRLFINRKPGAAAGRTLRNSEAAEAFFRQRDFDIVYPETLSIAEQAQCFASAGVVAGVHGAGLANIVYCAPGTSVVEFYGAHIAPCYWLISGLSQLNYYQHPCGTEVGGAVSAHAADFSLPLDEAGALLDVIDQQRAT
jgi:capsular polysaccharide biosynthesis protein